MLRLVVSRLLTVIPSIIGVTFLVFLTLHLIPGNPAEILLYGTTATPQEVARVNRELGLTEPLLIQYFHYLENLVHLNLGYSFVTNTPVASLIGSYITDTLILTAGGMTVALSLGVSVGILAALRPGGLVDRFATLLTVLGASIPYFWLALLLVWELSVRLHFLPALGIGSWRALILPSVSLGFGYAAIITRLLRAKIIEVGSAPYVLVARAKGLSRTAVVVKHILRNSLSAVLAVIALQIASMIASSVTIEVVFGRPGLGSFLVQSITEKDIPAIQGIVLLIALIYIFLNLVVDVLQAALDPRLRGGR